MTAAGLRAGLETDRVTLQPAAALPLATFLARFAEFSATLLLVLALSGYTVLVFHETECRQRAAGRDAEAAARPSVKA
jgi:hypothetical protein